MRVGFRRARLFTMATVEAHTREALLQARDAKEDIVHTAGIGSELSPSVYTWNDTGAGLAVLVGPSKNSTDEYNRITAAVMAFADGMGVHTVTVVKEGYAAHRGTEYDTRPLAVRFASGDPTVHECVTAVSVTSHGEASFAIQPFTIMVGRKVDWHDTLDLVTMDSDQMPLTSALKEALAPDGMTGVEKALEVLDQLGFAAMWSCRPAST